jgi:polyisoprenoid-binding protein YceI
MNMKHNRRKTCNIAFSIFLLLSIGRTASAEVSHGTSTSKDLPEATPQAWHLPQNLSDTNVSVRFTLDSTWHTIHGVTSGITGKASLKDQSDPSSVQMLLTIPVRKFDTDSGSRDRKMRKVMAADTFPDVIFTGAGLLNGCSPEQVQKDGSCSDRIRGKLTIRDVTKQIELPVVIAQNEAGYQITGEIPITWGEYNVEDPSILIASVDPVVEISFKVVMNPVSSEREGI